MLQELYTVRGKDLTGTPWTVYPRPQMKRDSYLNLNGEWEFSVKEPNFTGKTIRVPFCPESPLSGIQEHFEEGVPLWYRRSFALPGGFNRGRVLLHIGAADQIADVYVNGKALAHHEGGYEAITVDITEALNKHRKLNKKLYDNFKVLSESM